MHERMELETPVPLERSLSQLSGTSIRSHRRTRRLVSQPSSSASSIAASDKSLTSFPSFSPDSPTDQKSPTVDSLPTSATPIKTVDPGAPVGSIVESLTSSSPHPSAREALFEDSPLSTQKIPGALHRADDAHIERLISRHGAVGLIRQIAEDLARRDAEIAALRRRADGRERALRKIIFECGLSSLDLETRLRSIENDARVSSLACGNGDLSDLMSDAMSETVLYNTLAHNDSNDATIRAPVPVSQTSDASGSKGTVKGWKDYIWGGGSTKKGNLPSPARDESPRPSGPMRAQSAAERRPGLPEDLFNPPDSASIHSSSRASSVYSTHQTRKPSLASLALRLVAGSSSTPRDGETVRGRASSLSQATSGRTSPATSGRTAPSSRVASGQGGPKALMGIRRAPGPSSAAMVAAVRSQSALERWQSSNKSPEASTVTRQESYGPVEMDTILPLETQPPTLNGIYKNGTGSEYLTDRFGFIYDQRRKKRQRQATARLRSGSRTEVIADSRKDQVPIAGGNSTPDSEVDDDRVEEGKAKRWQDYLKVATIPTELLSHTPSITATTLEVMDENDVPKSPGLITSEGRGFIPSASTTTSILNSEVPSEPDATMVKDDTEPVKLLLQQLSELHDSLQKEKTVRWNDFLRKVRAERRREGEAAAAAGTSVMPETKLADGEMIGIAGLGNKGKVGRAKWNEFKGLVLGGVPVSYRAKIWAECCGATGLRIPGYYDDLVSQSTDDDDPAIVAQIKMDINRTLTDNIFFREGPGVAKLNEVLLAYARRNSDVGYCQGMNLIAANLLLIMPSAEDAFWILASFVEVILPTGYYDHSLLTSRADQQVLRQYVTDVLPKLSQHLNALGVELEALTFQWFLSVFTDCLSAEALFRVWDVVLCTNDGSTFLFQVALALLKLNEQQLLLCQTPATVYTYINHQMTNHAISIDGLIHASEALRRLVRREDVEGRRANAVDAERGGGSGSGGREGNAGTPGSPES